MQAEIAIACQLTFETTESSTSYANFKVFYYRTQANIDRWAKEYVGQADQRPRDLLPNTYVGETSSSKYSALVSSRTGSNVSFVAYSQDVVPRPIDWQKRSRSHLDQNQIPCALCARQRVTFYYPGIVVEFSLSVLAVRASC